MPSGDPSAIRDEGIDQLFHHDFGQDRTLRDVETNLYGTGRSLIDPRTGRLPAATFHFTDPPFLRASGTIQLEQGKQ
jgi:hypothetical protein